MTNPNEFKGAICAACDSPLDVQGYCTNDACGFASYHQDEPGGWLANAEREETLDGEDEDDAEPNADRLRGSAWALSGVGASPCIKRFGCV